MPEFDKGISHSAREDWSGGRDTPSSESPLQGFYTGIVMDDADDQRMGQIWVYIGGVSQRRIRLAQSVPTYGGTAPDRDNSNGNINWDQDLRLGWIQVAPLLPFFGGDDYRVSKSPGGDFRNAGNGDVNAYGFWAQPRIGDEVGIMFAHGDPAKGYWIGCMPKYARNFMVPGNPGRPPADLDAKIDEKDEENPNPAIHKLTKKLKEEAPGNSLVPAMDKARRLSRNTSIPVERELVEVLIAPEAAQNIQKSGLLCDPLRGAGTSSSRRESPSYVFGFKSAGWNFDSEKGNLNTAGGDRVQFGAPGNTPRENPYKDINTTGHQLTFDDHPDNQGVRLRTSAGSQLYFSDRCADPYIYITTAQGNVWVEMVDNGKVNIFTEDSVSVHSRSDINLTADRDINIDAQRDFNLQVRRNTNLKLKGENKFEFGKNDLPPKDLKYEDDPDWGDNTDGGNTEDTTIQSFGDMTLVVGNTDSTFPLDPGEQAETPNQARNFCINVSQNVDWTIGNNLNIDVGHNPGFGFQGSAPVTNVYGDPNGSRQKVGEFDLSVSGDAHISVEKSTDWLSDEEIRVESLTSTIDVKASTAVSIEAGTTMDLLAQNAGRWTAGTLDYFATTGNITMTGSSDIHLNGPQAATAEPADSTEGVSAVIPCVDPVLPKTDETFRVPTSQEVKDCIDPPAEFRTLERMEVPQHQPWPARTDCSSGTRGFADEAPADVSRSGSTTLDSAKPINLPEETRFREAQDFSTDNEAEEASYIDAAPRGEFNDCSVYTTSEKGIQFLHRQEGFRTKAYPDASGYSIGYGHFVKVGDTINGDTINGRVTQADIDNLHRTKGELNISPEEADRLFRQDLQRFEEGVCRQVDTKITQGQFDAMVSYSYNGGEGALRRMVQRSDMNTGDFSKVPQQWMKLSTCSKCPASSRARTESVLRRRRRQELETLFAQA